MSEGKRRFACSKCGRVGTAQSMESRVTFRRRDRGIWARRASTHGRGLCRNRVACWSREQRKLERGKRRRREEWDFELAKKERRAAAAEAGAAASV